MTFSVYDITIPVMLHGLNVLDDYLVHAETLEDARGLSPNEILAARLTPDMLTFGEQFSVVANKVERHVTLLLKRDPPTPKDVEQTYKALKARLIEIRLFLQVVKPEQINGAETHTFQLSPPIVRGWFGGSDYIVYLVMPDFFFHVATAHSILRHLGAPIGKRDYLGQLNMESGGAYS